MSGNTSRNFLETVKIKRTLSIMVEYNQYFLSVSIGGPLSPWLDNDKLLGVENSLLWFVSVFVLPFLTSISLIFALYFCIYAFHARPFNRQQKCSLPFRLIINFDHLQTITWVTATWLQAVVLQCLEVRFSIQIPFIGSLISPLGDFTAESFVFCL